MVMVYLLARQMLVHFSWAYLLASSFACRQMLVVNCLPGHLLVRTFACEDKCLQGHLLAAFFVILEAFSPIQTSFQIAWILTLEKIEKVIRF